MMPMTTSSPNLTKKAMLCMTLFIVLLSGTASAQTPGACENQGTFTSASGTQRIESDTDGYSTTYTYLTSTTCTWTLNCNAGEHARINGRFQVNSGDTITFNDGTSDFRSMTNTNDHGGWRNYISPTADLVVTFVTDASDDGARGFEADISCLPAQCSDGRTETTITSFPQTFDTDSDGSGNGRTYYGELCNWPLQCPVGQFVTYTPAALGSTVTTDSSASVVIQDSSETALETFTTSSSPNLPGTVGELVIGTSNVGYVKFIQPTYTSTTNTGRGFEFTVDCSTQQCSYTDTTVTAYPTTMQSDADGSGSGSLHHRGENCATTMSCPGGMFGVFTYTGDIGVGSDYVRFETTGASQILEYTASATAKKTVHTSNEYVLKYVTGFGNAARNGFTIEHDCLSSQCSAYTGTNPTTAYPVELTSDADGSGSTTSYANGEACNIQITCPTGLLAKVDYSVATADANDAFEILDDTSANLAGPFSGTTLQTGSIFSTNNIAKVTWTTNVDDVVGDGFTATLNCAPTSCLLDPPANPAYVSTPKSIRIQEYPSLPQSTITCPASVVAGQRALCVAKFRGHCGDLYGDITDPPLLGMHVCPKEIHLSNGDTSTMTYNNATFLDIGTFQFEIWPRTAGLNNVTISVGNPMFTVGPTSIRVVPGPTSIRQSSSECEFDPVTRKQRCDIVHRDALGNRVTACAIDKTGDTHSGGSCEYL